MRRVASCGILSLLMLGACGWNLPAHAQQRSGDQSQMNQQQVQGGYLNGRIVRTKTVDVFDGQAQHLIVLVETESGKQVAIDLGSPRHLPQEQITSGAQIRVDGKLVKIGDRQLIIAERAQINGQSIRLQRRQPEFRQVSAEIQKLERVTVPGMQHPTVVALLQAQDGTQLTADLGAPRKVQELDLQEGDRVQVQGRVVRIRGGKILFADQVQANGRTVQLTPQFQRGQKRVSGEIARLKQVQPPGRQESTQLAVVQTDQGRRVPVNLGSTRKLQQLSLQQGDQVEIVGQVLDVRGYPILIAQQVESQGQRVDLAPVQITQQTQQVRGQIAQLQKIQPPGAPIQLQLALVETNDGRRLLANLGLTRNLQQVDLQEGDSVQVKGRVVTIHGRPVLLARQLQTQGQRVELQQFEGRPRYQSAYREQQQRPRLGVRVLDTPDRPGVTVLRVYPNSPAEQAGLWPGDRIVEASGQRLRNSDDLQEQLTQQQQQGPPLQLTVLRGDQQRQIEVDLQSQRQRPRR